MGRPLLDLAGQTFTYLFVEVYIGRRGHSSHYRCKCRCGTVVDVSRIALLNGTSKSCGCFRAERMGKLALAHGMARHKRDGSTKKSAEYKTWDGIKERCFNPNSTSYSNYGGRGVTMCEKWRHSFEEFFSYVGARPSSLHSIDRWPNRYGNYEPGNVRWATAVQQGRNKRTNRIVNYDGVSVCLVEAAEMAGLPYYIVKNRIYKGWSVEQALAEPVNEEKVNAWRRSRRMAGS